MQLLPIVCSSVVAFCLRCGASRAQPAGAAAVPAEPCCDSCFQLLLLASPVVLRHGERSSCLWVDSPGHLPRKAGPSSSQTPAQLPFSWLCLSNPSWACVKGKVARSLVFRIAAGPSCVVKQCCLLLVSLTHPFSSKRANLGKMMIYFHSFYVLPPFASCL